MATSDYTRGEMGIAGQKATWDGFIKGSTWGSMIIILMVGYATLAVAMGMNWMIALGLMAAVGIGGGMFMKMGARWMATVVLLIGLALVVQGFIWLFGAVL